MRWIAVLYLNFILCCAESYGQAQGPYQGSSATYQFAGCLSCPGGEWNNPSSALVADNIYSDVSLQQSGFCFQTSCYYSRALMLSGYMFNLPANAAVTGVEAHLTLNSTLADAITDTLRLMISGQPMGQSLNTGLAWPDTTVTLVVGGPNQLWGANLTPADVNDPGFGVLLQAVNNKSVPAQARMDAILLKIYYTLPTPVPGIMTPENRVWYDPQQHSLRWKGLPVQQQGYHLIVSDILGRRVIPLSAMVQMNRFELPLLEPGIYLYEIRGAEFFFSGSFAVTR